MRARYERAGAQCSASGVSPQSQRPSHWRLTPWAREGYGALGLGLLAAAVMVGVLGVFGRG